MQDTKWTAAWPMPEQEGNSRGNGFSIILTPRESKPRFKKERRVENKRGKGTPFEASIDPFQKRRRTGRSRAARRSRRVGDAIMSWWQRKVMFPVKRAWLVVSSRVIKSRKHGGGILKLSDDVQMCGYRDVQVMWEILTKSDVETSTVPKPRKRSFWRLSSWYNRPPSG